MYITIVLHAAAGGVVRRMERGPRITPPHLRSSAPKKEDSPIVAIFYPSSQFCEIDVSLLSLQTQPDAAPNLFQRGVEYGKYVPISYDLGSRRTKSLPIVILGSSPPNIDHTCHILPPSEIDLGLRLAVFAGSGGEHLFHRIGRKGRIWQLCRRTSCHLRSAGPKLCHGHLQYDLEGVVTIKYYY